MAEQRWYTGVHWALDGRPHTWRGNIQIACFV